MLRLAPLLPVRPCAVYTDARGEGRLVAFLRHPYGVTAHSHAPSWMHFDAGRRIYERELLEALLGMRW